MSLSFEWNLCSCLSVFGVWFCSLTPEQIVLKDSDKIFGGENTFFLKLLFNSKAKFIDFALSNGLCLA